MVPLSEILLPTTRPVPLVATETYRLLGAHWYAEGLYIKDVKAGSEIQADRLFKVSAGDFVYNRLFAWKGSFALAGKEVDGCYVSGEFPCFRVCESRLDGRYLHYYFARETVWNEALGLSSGGTPTSRNRLKEKRLLAMCIPLPTLEEQRRIVERIEAVNALLGEALSLRKQTTEATELLLYLEAKRFREELLLQGKQQVLGEITDISSGGTPDRSNASFWLEGTIPWVKTGELKDSDINDSEEKITPEAVSYSSAKVFPPETVLIAMYGQGQTRGRTGILKIAAATNQACAAISPKPDMFVSKFLQYWLRSLYHEMRKETRAGAQPNWNAGMISRIKVVMPSLAEQLEVVDKLDTLERQVLQFQKTLNETDSELAAIMPSVLKHAFSGQL